MPVRQIVEDGMLQPQGGPLSPFGAKITKEELNILKQNYKNQNRKVVHDGKKVSDANEAWIPLSDLINMVNITYGEGSLKLDANLSGIGVKIFYGAHGNSEKEISVADKKVPAKMYIGLHTVMLALTKDYDPDKEVSELLSLGINPTVLDRVNDYLVDGVHLCPYNCL